MATLINNIATLKANFGGVDANFTWPSISSFMEDVERDILSDAIGDDALAYFAGNLALDNAVFQKALTLIRRAEAYLAIFKWSQTALFKFTDKSLYVATTADGVVISDKKLRDLRNYCEESGFNYLDKAIGLMEANLNLFTAYSESGIRQTELQGFIKTAAEFSQQCNIDGSRLTFLSLRSLMLDAQDEYLPGRMGSDFYASFKEKFLDEELTADELKLLPFIKKSIAFLAMSKGCGSLPVKVTSRGLLINKYADTREYDQKNPADPAQVQFLADDYLDKGERKLQDLRNYLVTNASLYPLFVAPVVTDVSENEHHSGIFSM